MDEYSIDFANQHDRNDGLARFREEFRINDQNVIYLDGNSLGRMPRQTPGHLTFAAEHAWGDRLIQSWNEGWYTKSVELGDKIASIAGASKGEIIVTDSTSVNLYKLVHSALRKQNGRKKIITDDLNFPSDIYILQGIIKDFGKEYTLEILHSNDGMTMDMEMLENAIDENTALLTLSHVVFKSSFMYPMQEVSAMAHKKGALVLWDLSHSIGAVPGELNNADVDMAVGCTYKYLNGGPGAPAFLYVRKDLQDKLESPICGWFGQKRPFDFELDYKPAEGISRFLAGTPPILSLVPLENSLDILISAGMDNIRNKSVDQAEYLLSLIEKYLFPLGFKNGSPSNPNLRGSHISIRHPEAYRICKAMIDSEIGNFIVIPDFREPDNIRIGITPLYTRFVDLYYAVREIEKIVFDQLYKSLSDKKGLVT